MFCDRRGDRLTPYAPSAKPAGTSAGEPERAR